MLTLLKIVDIFGRFWEVPLTSIGVYASITFELVVAGLIVINSSVVVISSVDFLHSREQIQERSIGILLTGIYSIFFVVMSIVRLAVFRIYLVLSSLTNRAQLV